MCQGLMPRGYWQEENDKTYLDPVISEAGGRYIWVSYNSGSRSCSIMRECESLRQERSGVITAKYCNNMS